MALNIHLPENTIMKPEITVFGVGGAGGNATNNMIKENLEGVNFVVANTDAQALAASVADNRIQLGQETTRGLGAGATPEVGRLAAEEAMPEIIEHLKGSNMVFITAGMGGGTGTGAAPVVARAAREMDILTVGVVTKPFHFEGPRRMRLAEEGLDELQKHVDTLIVIPNQNLFRIANEKTTFADAFKMADNVLHRGVRGVTDLMIMPGLINLDFADVKAVMGEMGKAMMGTGEAEGERRAQEAAEAAISNPLLDNVSMKGARGVLINITGGSDMTLFEVDEAANRIREEVDVAANIIFGSTFNDSMEGRIRVSVVATGIDSQGGSSASPYARKSYAVKPEPVAFIPEPVAEANIAQEEDDFEEYQAEQEEEDFADEHEEEYADEESYETAEQEVAEKEPAPSAQDAALSSSIADGLTPSNVDDEYFEAIRKLNEEYKARLASEKHKQHIEETADNNYFVSPSPVQPNNYVESGNNDYDEQPYHAEEEKAQGGLFSRMARVARSLQGNSSQAEEEETYDEPQKSPVKAASKGENEEDLMDIPAFLRRKA
jgi:cell division protein FtsZ